MDRNAGPLAIAIDKCPQAGPVSITRIRIDAPAAGLIPFELQSVTNLFQQYLLEVS